MQETWIEVIKKAIEDLNQEFYAISSISSLINYRSLYLKKVGNGFYIFPTYN